MSSIHSTATIRSIMFKRFVFGRRQSTLTFNVLSLDGTILTFDLEVCVATYTFASYSTALSHVYTMIAEPLHGRGCAGSRNGSERHPGRERILWSLIANRRTAAGEKIIPHTLDYLPNSHCFYLQHWLVLTKPLKKQLPGIHKLNHCTELATIA